MDIKSFIEENIINKSGKINPWSSRKSWWVKNGYEEEYNIISNMINTTDVIKEKICAILYYGGVHPKCKICDNHVKYHPAKKRFMDYCSNKCVGKDIELHKNKNFNPNPEKIKETKLLRYGDENYCNSKKFKETCLERYGVDNPAKYQSIKDKISEKTIGKSKSGIHWKQDRLGFELLSFINDKEWLKSQKLPQSSIAKNLGVSHSLINKKFKEFGIISKNYYKSSYEYELVNWLKKLNIKNIIHSDRSTISPMELDIYLPDYNLAIEFDGLYWHSTSDPLEIKNIRRKHLKKTNACEDKDIQLLHIFENEWITKKDIWKSVIKSKLGLSENRIYARKCVFKPLDNKSEVKQFLDDNHLQGRIYYSFGYGLYYNDELVSVMVFSKSRFSKNGYEILRFCNKLDHNVIGAFSKILKNSKLNDVISYGNRRWCYSKNNVYSNNGFELKNISTPNYFYFKKHDLNLQSRNKYQKHKLYNLLENYNENKSEFENMLLNNYRIIFDSGNLVYKY